LQDLFAKKLAENPKKSYTFAYINLTQGDSHMDTTKETVKTTLKPIGNRVLAKRLEQEEKLKGGLILPDSAKKKQETALVIAVGPGLPNKEGKLQPMPVQVGDKILMDKYSGQEVNLDDEEFVIVKADDIVAIVE